MRPPARRIVHVDPVVGEEVVAREDERSREEVAIREPAGAASASGGGAGRTTSARRGARGGGHCVGARDRLAAGLDRRDLPSSMWIRSTGAPVTTSRVASIRSAIASHIWPGP